jgi:hypothetical protein
MQVSHQSFASIALSKARVAASNLSRQPVLQKPTTLPWYLVSESALTGFPDQGHVSLTQSSRRRSSANQASEASFSALATASSIPPTM